MHLLLPLAALAVALTAAPAGAAERDPIDRTARPAPDGTPMCAAWVHDRHRLRARDGRLYPTWHPPRDPRYGCAFGHEHGSNPEAFVGFRRTGMPAFGKIGRFAGADEPHPGFKVFVTNDDRTGLAWMMVLHQGSGSPRRGTVRFHSLETWLFKRGRGGGLVAHTRRMADFGRAVANCRGAARRRNMRLLPHPDCRPVGEDWMTALDVGGVFRAWPSFAIDNPITQFDPLDPERVVFNTRAACGPRAPGGWRSRCKGDRRTVRHPRWLVENRGNRRFRTDAFGRRSERGLRQFVSNRIRVNRWRERGGPENRFVIERTTDGGLFRPGRPGRSVPFEQPGYCVLRAN